MIIIYKKSNLSCVGTVIANMTIDQEVELNVIPNFGGTADDYDVIETSMSNFHLELIADVVTPVENTDDGLLSALVPTTEEQEQAEFEIRGIDLLIEMGLL